MTEEQARLIQWTQTEASKEQIDKWYDKLANNALASLVKDEQKRRDAITGHLLFMQMEEILPEDIGSEEFIRFVDKDAEDFRIAKHFYSNVKRALDKAGYMDFILEKTGQSEFDMDELEYLGGNAYKYMGLFLIDFSNSPFSIELRYLGE